MDRLLRLYAKYAQAFIDNIVIFSNIAKEHLRYLETLFSLFVEKNIAILAAKSFIGYPNVELLGFRVNSLGLTTTA